MAYYNLKIVKTGEILSDAKSSSAIMALELFGRQMGVELTFEIQSGVPPYLFEEWSEGPHWINPQTPVWEA